MKIPAYLSLISLSLMVGLVAAGCNRSANLSSPSKTSVNPTPAGVPALTVAEVASPAGPDSREPEMYSTPDGRIILSWVEKIKDKRYALRFAVRDGAGWSEPQTVAEGDNWFINWADFPSIISTDGDSMAAHWLVKSGSGTYAYDVNISLSKDNGKSWGKPVIPHTDKTQTEHGFVSLFPLGEGRLGASWVDGRNLEGVNVDDDHGPLPASMSLRYASIGPDGQIANEAILDDRICECCQTSADVTSEGAIIVYRDRSEKEVRDIYFVREEQGKWSEPRAIYADGWEIAACPVNGPSVSADKTRVAVAWFTEAGDTARVQLAFSTDAGRTFGNPLRVDDGQPVGRVDVVMLADGSALVCWLSGSAEKGAIKVRRVLADGSQSPVAIVAETDVGRSSGFPRMARLGNEVFFAWTQFGKPSLVLTGRVAL